MKRLVAVVFFFAALARATDQPGGRILVTTGTGTGAVAASQVDAQTALNAAPYSWPAGTTPSTRPDGSALQANDRYYLTSSHAWYYWTGAIWSAESAGGSNPSITNDATTNATMYPAWVTTASGNQPLYVTSSKLYFNPSTGLLTSTGFAGPLTGAVTGNCSGSSGSCTGNAVTATTAAGLSATLVVSSGGTGLTSTTAHYVFIGPATGTAAPTWRTLAAPDMGSGTASGTTFLAGDLSWKSVGGGTGDVVGPATNTDAYLPQWNGANSKILKDGLAAATANTASALVLRDGTGNFSAGTITAALTGSATSLKSPSTTGVAELTGMAAASTRIKTVRDADDTLLELGGSYTPTAAWNWATTTTSTWPTFNQSTTGSAASLSVSGQTGVMTVTGLTSTNRAKTVRDAADTILELGGSYTPTAAWNWATTTTTTWPTFNQNTTGTAAKATVLATARALFGSTAFDGSAAITDIIGSAYGGTGNGFTKFTGPATTEKTFTLPNASATLMTTGANAATYNSTTVSDTAGGGTVNIDLTAGNVHLITLTASTTLTFTAPLTGFRGTLVLLQGGTGSYTITWPTIKWPAATAPTLTTAAGKADVIWIMYIGTTYYGGFANNF